MTINYTIEIHKTKGRVYRIEWFNVLLAEDVAFMFMQQRKNNFIFVHNEK